MRTIQGEVNGSTVALDRPLPALDGRRVRLVIVPESSADIDLGPEENLALWRTWMNSGPQGPIEVDEEVRG